MKCPRCGSDVRPSKKYPGYYLCDSCRKRFPETSLIPDDTDDDYTDYTLYDTEDEVEHSEPMPSNRKSNRSEGGSLKSKGSSSRSGKRSSSVQSRSQRRSGKKKKRFTAMLLILLLTIILFVVIAVKSGLISKDVFPFTKSSQDSQTDETTEADEAGNTYTLGDTATLNDISIQVTDYEESKGDEWASPQEGNVFVFVNLTITNQTEKDITVSSMASFESYCNKVKLDYSVNAFTALATNTDRQQMDGSIAPGSSLNGYLCLEVPTDWMDLEIHYTDQVWKDEGVVFKISK